jgi:hypothetical protein
MTWANEYRYAASPLGDLRFRKPVDPVQETGVISAKEVRCVDDPYKKLRLILPINSMVTFVSAYRTHHSASLPFQSRTRRTASSSMSTLQRMHLIQPTAKDYR